MTTRITLTLSIIALVAIPRYARADTLESVEKRLASATKKVTSFKANRHTTTDINMSGVKSVSDDRGTYEMLVKDGKPLWRVDSKTTSAVDAGGQKMKTETTGLMVCDGKFIWSLSETMGQKMVTKMKIAEEHAALIGASFFASMKKDHKLKLLSDETIEGKSAFVIEATPIKRSESEGATTYYILKDTALTVKTVTADASGKPITTMTLSDIKINVSIPATRFTFTPPQGVQVMDLTKQ
jgi:outer membrane lipoprotein-sorting protein